MAAETGVDPVRLAAAAQKVANGIFLNCRLNRLKLENTLASSLPRIGLLLYVDPVRYDKTPMKVTVARGDIAKSTVAVGYEHGVLRGGAAATPSQAIVPLGAAHHHSSVVSLGGARRQLV
eukprot:9486500-Pyramimonas_sp.AAC.1